MMRRPLPFDFTPGSRPPGRSALLLLAAAAAVALLALLAVLDSRQSLAQHEAELAALEARSRTPRPVPAGDPAAVEQRVHALNPYIRALNFPWVEIVAAVQPPASIPVALLSLDTDGTSGEAAARIRISAQAPTGAALADYLEFLAGKPSLRDVYLLGHEASQERDGAIQFAIEAAWQGRR